LRIVSELEGQEMLYEWNEGGGAGEAEEWREKYVTEECEVVAERRGVAVAVRSDGEELSHEELNKRGDRLGRYLREAGVGAEEVVGLRVGRTVRMVEGMLGVLK